jgi:hypothetical protein
MPADRIARRSVAFFLIKSSVNFVAVAVLGAVMAVGLGGPHQSLLLTALPAALSVAAIALVVAIPRLGPGREPVPGDSRLRRAWLAARRSLIGGIEEAVVILRGRDLGLIAGAIGYWIFDTRCCGRPSRPWEPTFPCRSCCSATSSGSWAACSRSPAASAASTAG